MKKITRLLVMFFLLVLFVSSAAAQEKVELSAGSDIVSRYVWRGLDLGKSPAFQPALSINYVGVEVGVWGSYTFNETASAANEIDAWISYTIGSETFSATAIITDYYFPNSGIKIGNFNNYDDPNGPGAHTLEAGLSLTFGTLPLSLAGYYNFYNDAGNNAYFQIDFPFEVQDYELNLFCGAAKGSDKNPGYYGTQNFDVINFGVTASRSIKISDEFSLPVFVTCGINPRIEQAFMVAGISL